MYFRTFLFHIIIFSIAACSDQPETVKNNPAWSQEQSIQMNAAFAAEELEDIERFLDRRSDWKMTETGSGLQYFIYESIEGDKPIIGDVVWVNFSVSLLDNKVCYTSKRNEPESFMVEKSDIESGIHEGVQLMAEGEKAKLILPSHLAHGLIGDLDEIPPLEPVIYDIELVKIIRPNE